MYSIRKVRNQNKFVVRNGTETLSEFDNKDAALQYLKELKSKQPKVKPTLMEVTEPSNTLEFIKEDDVDEQLPDTVKIHANTPKPLKKIVKKITVGKKKLL